MAADATVARIQPDRTAERHVRDRTRAIIDQLRTGLGIAQDLGRLPDWVVEVEVLDFPNRLLVTTTDGLVLHLAVVHIYDQHHQAVLLTSSDR